MISENSMMPTPVNDIDVVKIPKDIPVLEFEDYDLMDDKDREKYIKDLERCVRSSYEYRSMISYLREYMNMNSCSFIPAVTNESSRKVKIEIHHSPFTLRDICCIILNKRMTQLSGTMPPSVGIPVSFRSSSFRTSTPTVM